MKLRNPHDSPVGGFYYDDPILGSPVRTSGTLDRLVRSVAGKYEGASIEVPTNLRAMIEDQICSRQPAGKCYYTKGLGDIVSQAIHLGARAIDKTLGTGLEKKARGCGGCARRRAQLNKLTQ